MSVYPQVRDNFSLRPQYAIDLNIETAYVSGGTQVTINNRATKHTEVSNSPFSSGSPRSYSTPNGRAGSVSGNLAESGSDSSWSFSFTYPGVPQYQNIWGASGYFTRFYPDSVSIGTIEVAASHSLLGSASASLSNIKHVFRTSYDANGGSVSPSSVDADSGDSITLPTPSRSGYNFLGWTSGGTNYGTGSYTVNATRTLVASWELAIPAPTFTDGINLGNPVRVGENWSDSISASNTYAALGQSGTSYQAISLLPGQSLSGLFGNTVYIGGTISATSSGAYTVRVRAFGPGGSTDTTASVNVRQALPTWTDTSLSSATKGTYYSDTFSASGATSWTISGVPSGLLYTGTSGSTITVYNTPTVYGNYTITATPRNSDGDAGSTQYISLTINDSSLSWVDNLLTSSLVTQGESYSDGVSATGSSNITYSVASGSLPPGITLNTTTGALTGTPTTPNTYTFTISATNGDSSSTVTTGSLSITVEVAGGYVKVWDGSDWVEGTVSAWNGSGWIAGTVKVRSGSSWTDSFSS